MRCVPLVLALLASMPAFAEETTRVRLTDGRVLEGTIEDSTEAGYVLSVGEESLVVPWALVEGVERVLPEQPRPLAPPAAIPVMPHGEQRTVELILDDGGRLHGELLSWRDDAVVLKLGGAPVEVPNHTVVQLVSRRPAGWRPVERSPVRAAPPVVAAARDDSHTRLPGWTDYTAQRLRLVDNLGDAIGPSRLGYANRDFGRENRRFFEVQVGEGPPLTIPEFVDLVDAPRLTERYQDRLGSAERKRRAGHALLAVGGGLIATGFSMVGVSAASGDFGPALVVPPTLGGGFPLLGVGIGLAARGDRDRARLRDTRLDRAFKRDEAWLGVQAHNRALREELDLPEDEELDGPDED